MSPLRALRPFASLLAAAALGAGLAIAAVAVLGGLHGETRVVNETTVSSAEPAVAGTRMSINEIYRRAAPGVVQITSTTKSPVIRDPFFGQPFSTGPEEALGSGFVIDKAGHIVTNYHVVR
jgi:S1-C subfamily serine protease